MRIKRIYRRRKTWQEKRTDVKDALKSIELLGYNCQLCDCDHTIHLHHIDGNHANDNLSNWVRLCAKCHQNLHWQIMNMKKYNEMIKRMTPTGIEIYNKLYAKINEMGGMSTERIPYLDPNRKIYTQTNKDIIKKNALTPGHHYRGRRPVRPRGSKRIK